LFCMMWLISGYLWCVISHCYTLIFKSLWYWPHHYCLTVTH